MIDTRQYDLTRTLFRALDEINECTIFLGNAEREGDRELVNFFNQVLKETYKRADQAKGLLWERINSELQLAARVGSHQLPIEYQ